MTHHIKPRGPRNNGLHYCSRCGKRGRSSEAVEMHIRDVHKGKGTAISEPPRAELVTQNVKLTDRVATLEAALRDVRHEICLGPVNDTLWHEAIPAETTVDFITNTLGDGWDYDKWIETNLEDK